MPTVFTRQSSLGSAIVAETRNRRKPAFSMSRLLSFMSTPDLPLDGYEREVFDTIKKTTDQFCSSSRFPVPLPLLADPCADPDVLTRDLSKGTATAGGYLVGTEVSPVAQLLNPWSVAVKSGAVVLALPSSERFAGDIVIPKVDSGMATYWLTTEVAPITQSDPTLDKLVLSPKTGGAFTKFSRLLARQSDVADALLQREMLRTIGKMLDTAILAGTGLNGQPTGIANTSGVSTPSGAFNWAAATTMEQTAADAGGDDTGFGFVTTPAVRRLLKQRTVDAGGAGAPLWVSAQGGDSMAGRRANVTPVSPAATVLAGPWSDVVVPLWGTPMLEINPSDPADFRAGIIQARIWLSCNVGVQHPASWSVHSALT